MESNQKKLYENFKKEAKENKDDIIRKRCEKAAAEILKSFPQFEKKVEEAKEKIISKDKSKRKK